jgi:hypothetical protein
MKNWTLALLMTLGCWIASSQDAQAVGYSNVIIARGEYREQIKSQDILHRPNRPGHFYGNTVRRRHYYGTALPVPRGSRR